MNNLIISKKIVLTSSGKIKILKELEERVTQMSLNRKSMRKEKEVWEQMNMQGKNITSLKET